MKIALVGDSGTGKTNIVRQLVHQSFCFTHFGTIHSKEERIQLGDRNNITVVDTPGSASLLDTSDKCLQNIDVFVIVFCITNRKSFDNVEKWRNIISTLTPASNPITWLLGTKCDLSESCTVNDADITECVSHGSYRGFSKVSAKDPDGVIEAFSNLVCSLTNVARIKKSVLCAREIKLCVLGLGSVGCSSLLLRFAKNSFSLHNITEYRFVHRFLSISGEKVKLCIHDLSDVPIQCLGSFLKDQLFDAVVFVFDITNLDTLLDLVTLTHSLNNLPTIRALIGTKIDLMDARNVTENDITVLCEQENIACYFEVSSKTGENVLNTFRAITQLVLENSMK